MANHQSKDGWPFTGKYSLFIMIVFPEISAFNTRIYKRLKPFSVEAALFLPYSLVAIMFGLVDYALPYMILPIYAPPKGFTPVLPEAAAVMWPILIRRFLR